MAAKLWDSFIVKARTGAAALCHLSSDVRPSVSRDPSQGSPPGPPYLGTGCPVGNLGQMPQSGAEPHTSS